jgi:chemotaxis protein MotB
VPWRCSTRRRRQQAEENHERWLVSYADFITLLFAFFVVMFSASQMNKKRVETIAKVYSAVMQGDSAEEVLERLTADEAGDTPDEEAKGRGWLSQSEMKAVLQRLQQRLFTPVSEGKIGLDLQPRGLVISLREAAFFDAGEETFRESAAGLLTEVGEAVTELEGQPIRLEGHTDNIPIRTVRFPSNWELSTARAIEVLDLLVGRFGIPPERVSVTGYGDQRPIETNDTTEGRGANRRVDIVILSRSAALMAPRQAIENSAPVMDPETSPELRPSPFRREDSVVPEAPPDAAPAGSPAEPPGS